MLTRRGWAHWVISLSILLLVSRVGGAETPPIAEEDLLPAGSQWEGKLAQVGAHPSIQFPSEVNAVLTITRRDGDAFEAELRETMPGMDITFLCRGRLIRRADMSLLLDMRSTSVKGIPNAGLYIVDVPYTARINGDSIKGTWKYVEKNKGIDLGGDFQLRRMANE